VVTVSLVPSKGEELVTDLEEPSVEGMGRAEIVLLDERDQALEDITPAMQNAWGAFLQPAKLSSIVPEQVDVYSFCRSAKNLDELTLWPSDRSELLAACEEYRSAHTHAGDIRAEASGQESEVARLEQKYESAKAAADSYTESSHSSTR